MNALFEHQSLGADWLASRSRAYLADVPGLGKTRTAITALHRAHAQQPLIVCPAIVRSHWRREMQMMNDDSGFIMSYDEITRGGNELMRHLFLDKGIDSLVLDEAHNLRHATAQRTLMLLGPNGYARRLKERVYCLSGTPLPKNPAEFWTVVASLFPEVAHAHRLKTFDDFKARFCVTRGSYMRGSWREKVLPIVRNEEEFKELLSAVMLRRTLDDVGLDVPALYWQTTRLDARLPADINDKLPGLAVVNVSDLAAIENDPHVARLRRRLGELKIKPVGEMLSSELSHSTDKVVVFAHHRDVLSGLRDHLLPFGVAYVDGSTTQHQRDLAIERFQIDASTRVFLGQSIACKEGVTLTAARRVVLVEPDWSAYVNEQLGKRIARIGQKAERCVGQMICLANTLDEAIVAQNLMEVKMAASVGLGVI